MREKKGHVFSQNRAAGSEPGPESAAREAAPRSAGGNAPRAMSTTEARLRAANKESWLGSKKGWSSFFKRLVP